MSALAVVYLTVLIVAIGAVVAMDAFRAALDD